MKNEQRTECSKFLNLTGFSNPNIRDRPWSFNHCKCSGCERHYNGETKKYEFRTGKDKALAKVWYLGRVSPSLDDHDTCEVCAKLKEEEISASEDSEEYDGKDNVLRQRDNSQNESKGKNCEVEMTHIEEEGHNKMSDVCCCWNATCDTSTIQDEQYQNKLITRVDNKQSPIIVDHDAGQESFVGDTKLDDPSDCEQTDEYQTADNYGNWVSEDENFEIFCFSSSKTEKVIEDLGPRKYNPLWTGEDSAQIGVFIRNLKIEGVDEENQCVDVQFYLNVVWLDKVLCEYVRLRDDIPKNNRTWFRSMTDSEYTKLWEQVREGGYYQRTWGEVHPHTNKWPVLRIWNTVSGGYEDRQNLISLNKEWIGKDTVYWRRLVRVKIYHCFKCRTYPFGYETVKLKLRLISYTKQHLSLLRTKLWYKEHKKQVENEVLAGQSFSYVHPDNSLLTDWALCSVHNGDDAWYSKFDHNDLSYRLPVYVIDGKDTQSEFHAMIILKRRSRFVVFNIWVWFSLSSAVSLLTYRLKPKDDLADRLAIAVGIIFVQMQLKIHASSNTPRMPFITFLDVHMWTSLLLVVFQAVAQVISAANVNTDDGEEEEFDTPYLVINSIVVFVVNMATCFCANHRKRKQGERIEARVEQLANFKENELNIGSMDSVNIKGYYKNEVIPLRMSSRKLREQRKENLTIKRTSVLGFLNYCKCCKHI